MNRPNALFSRGPYQTDRNVTFKYLILIIDIEWHRVARSSLLRPGENSQILQLEQPHREPHHLKDEKLLPARGVHFILTYRTTSFHRESTTGAIASRQNSDPAAGEGKWGRGSGIRSATTHGKISMKGSHSLESEWVRPLGLLSLFC